MDKPIQDRRIRRTHRLLKQGLAELMQEKDFKDITVRNITDRMDLNRGTFYLHYADTYDLLQKLESDTLSDIQKMIDSHRDKATMSSFAPVLEPMLDYIVENFEICRSLFVSNASSHFIDQVYSLIYKNGVELLNQKFPNVDGGELEYFVSFLTYGLVGLIKRWFDAEMSMEKAELVRIADGMVTATAERMVLLCAKPEILPGG